MIKRIIVLVGVTLFFNSCCDYYVTSMRGLRSKSTYKQYLKARIDPNSIGISTNIVYKNLKISKEEGDGHIRPMLDPISLNRNSFLLFHTNGNCYYFIEDTITKPIRQDRFNILKGDLNYVINKRDEFYYMDYNLANCGVFSKWDFEVKGDTIGIAQGSNKGSRIWYYYAKTTIQTE